MIYGDKTKGKADVGNLANIAKTSKIGNGGDIYFIGDV